MMMRGFFLFLFTCCVLLQACVTQSYRLESYNGIFNDEQLDSIYNTEALPPLDGWVKINMIDFETGDTIICRAFYKNLNAKNDSVSGIKYIYRRVNDTNYFTKQIIKNKK